MSMRSRISRGFLLLPAGLLPFFAGCSVVRLQQQSEQLAASPLLLSRLEGAAPAEPAGGALADLEDDLFSAENARRGYWRPFDLFQQVGAKVFLLEPYDPGRTPVLFVHGAAGSPRDWRSVIEHLDRRRFQAWVYSFPSGADIENLADLLYRELAQLRAKHPFATLHIAAHSLGGLVVRSFLGRYHDRFPYVRRFVSISTPWGGEERARLAPAAIPAWDALRPQGELLASLFRRRLAPEIDFYLFFGYRGHRGFLRSRNDGVVTLRSELSPAAQAEARRVYGFDESHTSILSSREMVSLFNALLSAGSRQEPEAAAPDGATAAAPVIPTAPTCLSPTPP